MTEEQASPLELEHLIGYAGRTSQSAQAHAADPDMMVYHASSLVVLASQSDPHRQTLLRGHSAEVVCLAQSLDGEYLASGQAGVPGERSGNAPVIVWAFREAALVFKLDGLRGKVEAVAISRDNRFVAGSDEEGRLLLWDLQSGQVANASKHERPISSVAFGPVLQRESRRGASRPSTYRLAACAGSVLKELTLDFNGRSMQFELSALAMVMPANGLHRAYPTLAYAAGDQFLLAGTSAGELCVFTVATEAPALAEGGSPVRKPGIFRACVPVSSGAGGVQGLALDGARAWLGTGDGKVKRFAGADQRWAMEAEVTLEGRVVALSFGADRSSLLVGTSAGLLYSLDAESLQPALLRASHTGAVVAAAFARGSSELVATASADGSVRVWDLSTYAVRYAGTRAGQVPLCLALGGELGGSGALVLSGWEDGAIFCHDPEAPARHQQQQPAGAARPAPNGAIPPAGLAWSIARAHAGGVTAVALTELALLSAGRDGKLRVWGLGSRLCEAEFSEHTKGITAMVVDLADPTRVHTCGLDQQVVTFDLAKKRRLTYHALKEGTPLAMVQRPHGELELLSASHDGLIHVWDVDEAGAVGLLREPYGQRLNGLALSPSGRLLALATEQGSQLQVWDVASGRPGTDSAPIAVGSAHSEGVLSVAWSPDEKQLVSVGKDGLVAVWNWFGS